MKILNFSKEVHIFSVYLENMNKKYFDTHLQKKQYNKANENNNIDLEDYKNIPILFKFITYICSY